eukprot:CAMPEP_0194146992 /NCGR_PEP_ID=MMETSP0152-20130528/22454_1 /TAXON_ID=1049557 /ORGANISM="Thalassiothrix antarctica, Strain L6-D1" /LENGTH=205 /DNA_ID=CAMNT_0038847655 /DNA_START=15 /DNA_END=632 /DNA_ORIENTATION=+
MYYLNIIALLALTTASIFLPGVSAGAYAVATGCQGKASGDTFNCHCKTGNVHMTDDTVVFNQCDKGKKNGAFHGEKEVNSNLVTNMGMAVYSGKSTDSCGGSEKRCKCTCFDMEAVEGSVDFRTSTSKKKGKPGKVTDCLGLCGPNCEQGDGGGIRYASILIHDICQSYIRSSQAMPNFNDCSDEGWHSTGAAILSSVRNGFCPT